MRNPLHTPAALAATAALILAGSSACARTMSTSSGAARAAQTGTSQDARAATSAAFPQLLVRRGSIDLENDNVGVAASRTRAMTSAVGGYVEREQLGEKSARLVLRVPADAFAGALDSLARYGRIKARVVSEDDVTTNTVDLDARVRALSATRDRLRLLLDRATSVSDVITVERELARVQGELDSLERRLAQLRSATVMSEITLAIRQPVVLGPIGIVFKGAATLLGKLFVIR